MSVHRLHTAKGLAAGSCLLVALFLGSSCSKSQSGKEDPSARQAAATGASGEKSLQEMTPKDVIVSVNGVKLTKADFEESVNRALKRLAQQPNMKRGQVRMLGSRYIKTYIPNFVNTVLLEQEARESGVLSERDLAAAVAEWIAKEAKNEKKPLDQFLKTVPGGAVALTNDATRMVLVEAVIATNVLPKVKVTDEVVQATIAAIKEENAAVDATNALKKAWLNELRGQIAAGADFGKLADIHSQCERSAPGCNGYWGEFERRDFINPKMREAVFKLKPGEVSEVLEDEEGFHLVKMLGHKGGSTNLASKSQTSESVSLAHILIRREPALEMSVPSDLKKQIFEQFKARETAAFLDGLRAKATIIYPNGTNFWAKANSSLPKSATAGPK